MLDGNFGKNSEGLFSVSVSDGSSSLSYKISFKP